MFLRRFKLINTHKNDPSGRLKWNFIKGTILLPFLVLLCVFFSSPQSDCAHNQKAALPWFTFPAHSDWSTSQWCKWYKHRWCWINTNLPHEDSPNGVFIVEGFLFPPKPILLNELNPNVTLSWLIVFFPQTFQSSLSVFEVNVFEVLFYDSLLWGIAVRVRLHFPEQKLLFYNLISIYHKFLMNKFSFHFSLLFFNNYFSYPHTYLNSICFFFKLLQMAFSSKRSFKL